MMPVAVDDELSIETVDDHVMSKSLNHQQLQLLL